jgi:hypothetical protein
MPPRKDPQLLDYPESCACSSKQNYNAASGRPEESRKAARNGYRSWSASISSIMELMVILYAGRRNLAAPEHTSALLKEIFLRFSPRLVIGSAAAGADLLTLEQARLHGLPAHVVILEGIAEFEHRSVADIGPQWSQLYHAMLNDPEITIETIPHPGTDDDAAHEEVNRAIATAAATAAEDDEKVMVVIVRSWPKPTGDTTEHLAELAADHGWQVVTVPDSQEM